MVTWTVAVVLYYSLSEGWKTISLSFSSFVACLFVALLVAGKVLSTSRLSGTETFDG